jgi:hypothetical protein
MRTSPWVGREITGLAVGLAWVWGCGGGGGGMQARSASDAGSDAAAEGPPDIADVAEASSEALEARDAADATPEASAAEASADAPADADEGGGDATDAADARVDLAVEKPPATATWTIVPNAMCTAAGAGCMDTGAVGGYQITASGSCPAPSGVQLWFPGGAAPLAAGTYAVKPTAGILDVIAMPAGMVGVLAERDDAAAQAHFEYWGRAGSVTVTAAGASRHVTFSGVSLREETSGVATTLAADVTCP